MSNNSFTVLINTRLSSQSRLYANSCCPDKDLIVLFSRLGGNDRMSLWNITQGTKKWETDIGDSNTSCTALAIAWSPDGQRIAVAREPPSVAVYSIQDGHRIHVLPITHEAQNLQLSGVWWFSDENEVKSASNIPDIFKRNQIVTGSALSVLKILPLLDHLPEDSESNLTATDVFAFQGSHNRSHRSSPLPDVIETWPTLAADHIAASISTSSYSKSTLEKAELNAMDNFTTKTILLASDDHGHVFPFLDSLYPLGVISFGFEYLLGLAKHQSKYLFTGQPNFKPGSVMQTSLKPTTFSLPLLATKKARDLAKLSSTARELMWYLVRVVKEMRDAWCGSESQTGAREFGMKWIRALEEKQKEFCAEDEPDAILDLTTLLTTGRMSEALTDFLGSGQDMSERGIHKWESTVTEALGKLRDFGEKRCAPGLQRVFLLLDELVGWAKLPQFSVFQLSLEDLLASRDLAGRGIIIASWLAAEARKELSRFREFIHWLRFEVTNVVSPTEPNTARHDILEVNHYFISGLTESSIDRWFIGPTPNFTLVDLNIPELQGTTLSQAIDRALKVVHDPMQTAWQMTARANDIRHLDRNLEALVQELTGRCQRIFRHAAGATSRSAVVSSHPVHRIQEETSLFHQPPAFPFRERTGVDKDGEWLQHLVVHLPSDEVASELAARAQVTNSENSEILLIQLRLSLEAIDLPPKIGVAILKCILPEEGEGAIGLLDADFFDDESVIIVYRLREGEKQCYIAMLNYHDVEYQKLAYPDKVKWGTREELMHHCMGLWKNGQMEPIEIRVNRRRLLSNCEDGGISLALNGRVGRRVACVLDGAGTSLESFDLEGEGDDVEDADDTPAD